MDFQTEVSGPPLIDKPPTSWIFDRLEEWTRRFPDRFAFALDQPQGVREYRYAEVLAQATGIAAGLIANGVQAGDRIGILMENIPEWVFILLGAMRAAVVTVPLPTLLPESHLANIAGHAGCRLIFADETNLDKARNVARTTGITVIPLADLPAFSQTRPEIALPTTFEPNANVLLMYTSGTTGDPKAVQLTLQNLVYEVRGIVEPLEISPDHRILSVLPFSHVLPLIANALGPLCVGAGVVFLSSISPQHITEAFHRHRITCFVCVPQFFYLLHKRIFAQVDAQPWIARRMFKAMRGVAKKFKSVEIRRKVFSRIHQRVGPELRLFASGGSKFDPRIAEDLTELGYTMVNAYGLTETTAAATVTPVRDNKIGSVGKPLRGVTVRVDSPDANGIGEVLVSGPLLMKGYYRDDAHTAEIIRDGWLHTGDLGFIDRSGNLTITGRSKDVIVLANGKNIYPEEIETQYGRSPFIKELCVLGVTNSDRNPAGETLHAIIVPDMDEFRRRGQSAIMEMIRFDMETLSKELPSYQRVLSFSIRNEPLPRTVTRKLKRFEIQAEVKAHDEGRKQAPQNSDHPRFKNGSGLRLATLIHKAKPDAGGLEPSQSLELDLGFDSLARVELLGELEAETGARLGGEDASTIYTLGELLDAIEKQSGTAAPAGRSWRDILTVPQADELNRHYIFKAKPFATGIVIVVARMLRLLSLPLFRLRWRGLENIPQNGPFLICPNHESFLDAAVLFAVLPSRVLRNCFSLGYSDYWQGAFSRRFAELTNIVAIDPNVNLVRAMQAGAVGLKRDKVLIVFPEGSRSIDGHVAEFKKGSAILACELGVPILPVGINGTFECWPRAGGFHFRPVDIVFGKPIDPRQFSATPDPYAALTEHLRQTVCELTGDSPLTAK